MVIGFLKKFARVVTSPGAIFKMVCLLCGCATGVALWAWRLQFSGLLGNSAPVASALFLAIATALAFGLLWCPLARVGERKRWIAAGAIQIGLAVWAWRFPDLIAATGWAAERWGTSLLESPVVSFSFVFCAAVIGLGIPCCGIAWLWNVLAASAPNSQPERLKPHHSQSPLIWQLFGFSGGLLVGGSLLGPWLGLQGAALIAAILAASGSLYCFWKSAGITQSADRELEEAEPVLSPQSSSLSPYRQAITVGILALAAANWLRMSGQLVMVSAELLTIQGAGVVLGLGLGVAFGSWRIRRGASQDRLWITSSALFAGWAVCMTALFPTIVESTLWMNSYVPSLPKLLATRTGLSWLFLLPMGITWGVTAVATAATGNARVGASAAKLGIIPAAIGFCCYRWLGIASVGPALTVTLLASGIWLLVAISLALKPGSAGGWCRRGLLTATLVIVALSPIWRNHYDPALTAKVLFSTDMFLAYRSKFDIDSLNQFDDSRLRLAVEGDRGTYTVWSRRGSQTQIRANGISKAVIAADTEIHPQYSAELLQAAYPLILHESPDRVLMLGLGSSVQLSTSLHFPVSEVVCYEPDAAYLRLMEESILAEAADNPLSDDRVVIRQADPALVAVAGRELFDVIISDPGQSGRADSAAYFTSEFYARLSRQLEAGGIFCQRFRYGDYGAKPIRDISATLQSAFQNVMLLQSAPGELLLLGTNDPNGLVRPGLLERTRTPQARAALADCGWDWPIVLNLSAHNQKHIADLTSEDDTTVNTISNGRFLCTLPREMMRWGQKQQEIADALASRTGRLLDWMGEDASNPDVLERLADVYGHQLLIRDYPDQYWAYRATVREQVTGGASKRSIIQQVKHQLAEHGFHPQDQRRMDYFEALGTAAKSKKASDIRHLSTFASPFDPMLSYFLHEEVAEIYSRAGKERDPADELRHRLYTTYYTVQGDRSVRNLLEAIALLLDHPESMENPVQRWDHINGLLQILQTRWYARGSVQPKSLRTMISDVSETLKVVDRTLKEMSEITTEAEIDPAIWDERHRVLRRTLIKPLRDYRQALIPQYEKAKATGRMINDVAEKHEPEQPPATKPGVEPAEHVE